MGAQGGTYRRFPRTTGTEATAYQNARDAWGQAEIDAIKSVGADTILFALVENFLDPQCTADNPDLVVQTQVSARARAGDTTLSVNSPTSSRWASG